MVINKLMDMVRADVAAKRQIKLPNGSTIIPIIDGLYDLFQGDGWKHQSRFRIIKLKGNTPRQLIQVNGLSLSQETRKQLLDTVGA